MRTYCIVEAKISSIDETSVPQFGEKKIAVHVTKN
jgi:hypothetical protein